jgi:hypothetical protein
MYPQSATATDLYVCDGCDDTVVCRKHALSSVWKWRLFKGQRADGEPWTLLLCPDCRTKEKT